MANDLSLWAAIASGFAALVSAWFAYVSIRVSKRSLRLSEQQEERHHPHLVPYLIDGYVKFVAHEHLRVYGFSLSISNRSDADDSVAQLELQLTYRAPSGISIAERGKSTQVMRVKPSKFNFQITNMKPSASSKKKRTVNMTNPGQEDWS